MNVKSSDAGRARGGIVHRSSKRRLRETDARSLNGGRLALDADLETHRGLNAELGHHPRGRVHVEDAANLVLDGLSHHPSRSLDPLDLGVEAIDEAVREV